ncbi:hypothetical protein ABZT27_34370 [Streptomyces sp. NPDC005389]|uniref:hypothetical protein n=1 Tax=Streptomyces sp. NPDC005389 TaxID=3157040 RepID=UPI0033BD3372
MATPNPTVDQHIAARRATVRQLDAAGHSRRAIARQLGIHHRTVARDLSATSAPQPPSRILTSTEPTAPRQYFTLTRELIQDLNVLADKRTGDLPAPLVRAIHAAADRRRAAWILGLEQHTATQE